ncbi:kynurenine/alpha-aminoadipate aminotransferase, mitochondrial [Orussus abietinus]|uniref:kynurenine/alpha-aminoadipate aminotransferase, mitochondrial n=1 Tax=Orussus abietinus TaxID=222816 RepID=UPI000626B8DA|nr:kynurenine/alpha-aminoadipate aminotransferase, mitochondrial [Orussus abietinus]
MLRREFATKSLDYSRFISKSAGRRRANMIRKLTEAYMVAPKTTPPIFFAGGMPNSETFPFKEVVVTLKDGLKWTLDESELSVALQYGPTQGYPPLVKLWREFQKTWHSPKREDWDVVFTCGSQNGCTMIFELLLEEGHPVMVQSPTYTGIMSSLNSLAPDVIPIPQDVHGIIPEKINEAFEERIRDGRELPKVLYVNPTGSNPTGAVLSDERRLKVYELAQKYNFLIVEDDAYYFVHFLDKNPTSFLSIDTDGRVLRLDSFSKIMSAGLRLGVVTANKDIVRKLILSVESNIMHASSLSQVLVQKVLQSWGMEGFQKHQKSVQSFYRAKRDAMLDALKKHLTGLAEWAAPEAGMFVWIRVTAVDNVLPLAMDKCLSKSIFVLPGSAFSWDAAAPSQHLRLSYSYASLDDMDKGLAAVAEIIREEAGLQTENESLRSEIQSEH